MIKGVVSAHADRGLVGLDVGEVLVLIGDAQLRGGKRQGLTLAV